MILTIDNEEYDTNAAIAMLKQNDDVILSVAFSKTFNLQTSAVHWKVRLSR